ncbi:MAG: transporter substrate-binding domain-containing protein [Clostridia bacterium]|nr:transporter substrate-binding domain-containing protein [Clostridia bacterium]
MKKIIAIILALVMTMGAVVTMASCEKKEENSTATEEVDNTLVCGVTIFENMNELENGTWTGFESEFAIEVGKIIGMEVKFQEIDWSQKYNELNSGAIDCIWNGFTANSSDDDIKRSDLVDFSYGYMLNQQCIVVKKDKLANYTSAESLSGKVACVEGGSAGEAYAKSVTDEKNVIDATAQIDTFKEVSGGLVDFAVVDIILAQNICGKGDYENLVIVDAIELESEIYAVGFKKGSDLTAKVNAAIKELYENGKIMEIAERYGFENNIKLFETIE